MPLPLLPLLLPMLLLMLLPLLLPTLLLMLLSSVATSAASAASGAAVFSCFPVLSLGHMLLLFGLIPCAAVSIEAVTVAFVAQNILIDPLLPLLLLCMLL